MTSANLPCIKISYLFPLGGLESFTVVTTLMGKKFDLGDIIELYIPLNYASIIMFWFEGKYWQSHYYWL